MIYYVIKFVSNSRQVSGFLQVLPISSTNKTDCHDITEILLKLVLNTINIPLINVLTKYGDLRLYGNGEADNG